MANNTTAIILSRAAGSVTEVSPELAGTSAVTADCLETIEEMGMTNREVFLASGRSEYHLVPCLNDHPAWVGAMASFVEREAAGGARGESPDHAPGSLAAAARA